MIRIFGWLGAIAIATGVGLSSYAISNQVKAPNKVVALGVFPDATASGNFALLSFAARKTRAPGTRVNESELRLSQHAYRKEPLSTPAIALIAMGRREETRQSLFELAGKLTRRNALVSSELIRSAGLRNDDRQVFRWLSRVMLTNPQARKLYGAAMAEATARDGAVEALTPILGVNPDWSDYYWRLVAARPNSLGNAAELRALVARPPWRQAEITDNDRRLMLALVAQRQFDAAHKLYQSFGLTEHRQTRSLISNGKFNRAPRLPPFDWQLAVSGTLGSSIDEDAKSLSVSAISGARGYAARQLVRLSPGTYLLSWSGSASTPLDGSALSARIYCAEPGAEVAAPPSVPLATGRHDAKMTIADSSCQWHWLSIDVALPDDSPGVDVVFRSISLTAANDDRSTESSAAPAHEARPLGSDQRI